MSGDWQPFVESQLVGDKKCAKGCILGLENGVPWAASPDFMPRLYKDMIPQEDGSELEQTINEAKNLAEIASSGKKTSLGLRINGTKYMVMRTEPDPLVMYGKAKGGGLTLTKTAKCIIIGTYEGQGNCPQKFDCDASVTKLGDYLREQQC